MSWCWELPDWPHYRYDPKCIAGLEQKFLVGVGSECAFLKSISRNDYHRFVVEILSTEGVKSSKIEGELLDRESLQSSIMQHFGLKTADSKVVDKESQMAGLLCDVYESFDKPLTHRMLAQWHLKLFNYESRIVDLGKYRTHKKPMQIVSNRYGSPKVFYEAPPFKTCQK